MNVFDTMRETEISKEWATANPKLAVRHIINFLDRCEHPVTVKNRKGFILLTEFPA